MTPPFAPPQPCWAPPHVSPLLHGPQRRASHLHGLSPQCLLENMSPQGKTRVPSPGQMSGSCWPSPLSQGPLDGVQATLSSPTQDFPLERKH